MALHGLTYCKYRCQSMPFDCLIDTSDPLKASRATFCVVLEKINYVVFPLKLPVNPRLFLVRPSFMCDWPCCKWCTIKMLCPVKKRMCPRLPNPLSEVAFILSSAQSQNTLNLFVGDWQKHGIHTCCSKLTYFSSSGDIFRCHAV